MTDELESAGQILERLGLAEIPRLQAEIDQLRQNITFLFEHLNVSIVKRECVRCHAPMYLALLKSGRKMPFNPDGSSHFSSCPFANEFRKERKA